MRAAQRGMPDDGVRVLGKVSLERLTEFYRRAWLFCLPSSYEGFGVPYIEAMASGTAVVATRIRGRWRCSRAVRRDRK